jgi:hypothetical protein
MPKTVPTALIEAVAALWRVPPGPNDLSADPRFVGLSNICKSLYSKSGQKDTTNFPLEYALDVALRALGLPCGLVPEIAHLALPAEVAAARLDAAFRQTEVSRVHLCPLDGADDLPALKFGPNCIRKFTAAELEALVDLPRLRRINANWTFDAKRFSEFNWLMVKEDYPLDRKPVPFLSMPIDLNKDWGRIEPHKKRFAPAVEAALFVLLLAPWEDWAEMPENDWRGFCVPWVYTLTDDLFVRPPRPPSPDTLSWEPDFFHDIDGNLMFETERPLRYFLNDAGAEASAWLNDATWSHLTRVRQSSLFETPIEHFLVRAFLAEPLDEFLAHIITIEAALGLRSDHGRGPTKRMAARVSNLLRDKAAGEDYSRLFGLRSAFLHGRKMEDPIPGKERIAARRLARKVVNELIGAALAEPAPLSREDYLNGLR